MLRHAGEILKTTGHEHLLIEAARERLQERDYKRADDGNRTRIISLEGWSSTIELRPRDKHYCIPGYSISGNQLDLNPPHQPIERGYSLYTDQCTLDMNDSVSTITLVINPAHIVPGSPYAFTEKVRRLPSTFSSIASAVTFEPIETGAT